MASKPALRNLLLNQTKRDFAIALVAAIVSAGSYKYFVEMRRRETYDAFFKSYDADAAYERMKAAGVFQFHKNED